MHNVVSFLYYTAGSCIFNDDLDSILYVPLLIVYSVGSGVVSPKLCNFGNLKLRWRLHQSQNSPSGVCLWLGALRWVVCVDPVTDASGFPYRPSFDGGLSWCTGAVSCGRRHLSLRVGGRHARVLCVCACARPSWPGRAGRPLGRLLVRLTFSFGPFVFLLCLAPSGLGLPRSWSFVCPPSPLLLVFFSVSPLFSSLRPRCLLLSMVSGPGCPGPWRFVLFVLLALRFLALRALSLSLCCLAIGRSPVVAPPPLSRAVVAVPCCLALVFFSCLRPLVSGFPCFPAPAPGLGAGVCLLCSALRALCCFFFFPPLGSSCALAFSLSPGWPLVAAPPPSSVSRGFRCFRSGPWFFFPFLLCAPVVSGFLWFPAPGALGLGSVFCLFFSASRCPALRARSPRLCLPLGRGLLPCDCYPPPPPLLCLPVFVAPARCLGFFFLPLCAPVVSGFLWYLAQGALGLGAVRCLLCCPASLSPPTSPARGRWPSRARCPTGRGWPPPSPRNAAPTDRGSIRWTPKSSSTFCDARIASGLRESPRAWRRWSTRCPYVGSRTACARQGDTLGTRSGMSEPPRTTVTPYCTRRTGRRPRTPSCRTRPRALATPNSLSPVMTATSI